MVATGGTGFAVSVVTAVGTISSGIGSGSQKIGERSFLTVKGVRSEPFRITPAISGGIPASAPRRMGRLSYRTSSGTIAYRRHISFCIRMALPYVVFEQLFKPAQPSRFQNLFSPELPRTPLAQWAAKIFIAGIRQFGLLSHLGQSLDTAPSQKKWNESWSKILLATCSLITDLPLAHLCRLVYRP